MHFPVSFQPGVVEATTQEMMDDVPIEDTWRAMEKLVDEGLVRNIGCSNFEIDELKRIQAVATKPVRATSLRRTRTTSATSWSSTARPTASPSPRTRPWAAKITR